jgi:radical SAM protein with 4Fe4S-binding SPASM domain
MTFNQIKSIINEMAEKNAFILDISGGEPFLRRDIIDILKLACQKIPLVYILTNGIMLSDEKLVKKLSKNYYLIHPIIQISLNSVDLNYYNNDETYYKIIQGIKNTIKYKLPLNINTVVTRKNFSKIEKIILTTYKLGCKSHTFSEFVPVACDKKTIEKLLCSPYDYLKLQNEIIPKLQAKYPHMIITGKIIEPEFWDDTRKNTPKTPTFGSCAAFTTDITIGPDGRVLPCAWYASFPEFFGENVTKQSISKIWNESPIAKKLRKIKIKGKCETCEYNQICYKGCHALKYSHYKKIDIPDIKCWYNPEKTKTKTPPKKVTDEMLGIQKY